MYFFPHCFPHNGPFVQCSVSLSHAEIWKSFSSVAPKARDHGILLHDTCPCVFSQKIDARYCTAQSAKWTATQPHTNFIQTLILKSHVMIAHNKWQNWPANLKKQKMGENPTTTNHRRYKMQINYFNKFLVKRLRLWYACRSSIWKKFRPKPNTIENHFDAARARDKH